MNLADLPPITMPTLPTLPTLPQRPIEDLLTRIDARLPPDSRRIVGFIASTAGEGTSTLATAYVAMAAGRLRRDVLLLTCGDGHADPDCVLPALASGRPLQPLLRPLASGGFAASLGGESSGAVWELLGNAWIWRELRSRFDEVVLDLPAAAGSSLGVALAARCDGVVVVVQAGKTRAPVVRHLLGQLAAVRANVLGTVLNRRRFYLPRLIYRWL